MYQQFGYVTVNSTALVGHQQMYLDITIPTGGYLYTYVANESNVSSATSVYFDFNIIHTRITNTLQVVQTTDYYPFGLAMAAQSYQKQSSLDNDYLYNGKELQDEHNLGWMDYGARMYLPEIGRWGVVDPLTESRNWLTAYNYVQNNPSIRIDPDGTLDEYSIDNNGSIKFEKKTDDNFDMLYAKKDYDGGNLDNGIKVGDKSMLPELSKTEDVGRFEISKTSRSSENAGELFKVFKFASDNTNVEWAMYKGSDNNITLGTAHDSESAANYSAYGLTNEPIAKIHSHPGIDVSVEREMNSMGYINKNQMYQPSDWSNARNNLDKNGVPKVSSYVYFPNSTRLYNVNKQGPAYIRHINNDYKRLFVGNLK